MALDTLATRFDNSNVDFEHNGNDAIKFHNILKGFRKTRRRGKHSKNLSSKVGECFPCLARLHPGHLFHQEQLPQLRRCFYIGRSIDHRSKFKAKMGRIYDYFYSYLHLNVVWWRARLEDCNWTLHFWSCASYSSSFCCDLWMIFLKSKRKYITSCKAFIINR